IDSRKCPGISNPFRQKRDDRRRFTCFRQRRAITECNFHLSGRQRPGELLRNRAVRAIGCDQILAGELFGCFFIWAVWGWFSGGIRRAAHLLQPRFVSLPSSWGGIKGGVSRAANLSPSPSPHSGEGRSLLPGHFRVRSRRVIRADSDQPVIVCTL